MIPLGTVKVVPLPVHAKFVVTAKAGDARPSEAIDTETDAMKSAVRRRKGLLLRDDSQVGLVGSFAGQSCF